MLERSPHDEDRFTASLRRFDKVPQICVATRPYPSHVNLRGERNSNSMSVFIPIEVSLSSKNAFWRAVQQIFHHDEVLQRTPVGEWCPVVLANPEDHITQRISIARLSAFFGNAVHRGALFESSL
jgi:hypothetical protein